MIRNDKSLVDGPVIQGIIKQREKWDALV